jgi:putative protease
MAKKKKEKEKKSKEKKVGEVTHYFNHIDVAVVKLSGGLEKGDKIHIKGSTTDFEQKVKSMQIEHKQVDKAGKGKAVGMKIKDRVREGDLVYKVG